MTDTSNTVTPRSTTDEAGVLQRMITDLSSVPEDSRKRLIDTVCVFLGLGNPSTEEPVPQVSARPTMPNRSSSFQFSEQDAPSVKQFMHEKNPQTDVERVACLAYYHAQYRG